MCVCSVAEAESVNVQKLQCTKACLGIRCTQQIPPQALVYLSLYMQDICKKKQNKTKHAAIKIKDLDRGRCVVFLTISTVNLSSTNLPAPREGASLDTGGRGFIHRH